MSERPPTAAEPFKMTPKLFILSASVIVSVFMHALDATIANVALPHMQGSMNASLDQIAWVLTSYVVASAIATPLTAFLTKRFGRRRLFVLAVASFTLTSLVCGAAQNLEQLVLFRVLQGVSGAFMMPLSQSILLDSYPPERHSGIISIWLMVGMIAPIMGPVVGGYLTELYSWRAIFYINIPVGIASTIGAAYALTDSEHQTSLRFDFLGFVLLSVAVASFQLMLDRGTTLDWFSSKEIVIEASLAAITFYVFIVHALTSPSPYVNTKLFNNRNFCLGMGLTFLVSVVIFSSAALQPTMLQSLMGYPVLTASLLMVPRGIGMLVTTAITARLPRDLDPRVPIVGGCSLIALSMWQVSTFDLNPSQNLILFNNALQGAGLGFILGPLLNVAFSHLAPQLRTDGTSMYAMIRSLSVSTGVSIATTLVARNVRINHAELVEHITAYSSALRFLAPQAAWTTQSLQGAATIDLEVSRQAMMMAYIGVYRLEALLMVGAIVLILFVRQVRTPVAVAAE